MFRKTLLLCLLVFAVGTVQGQRTMEEMKKKMEMAKKNQHLPKQKAAKAFVADEGITSETHKKYVNQIVFSEQEIGRGASESVFISDYTLGDPIYLRAFLHQSLINQTLEDHPTMVQSDVNILKTHVSYLAKMYLDDDLVAEYEVPIESFGGSEKEKWTTFRGAFIKEGNTEYLLEKAFRKFIAKAGSALSGGSHSFKIELCPYLVYGTNYTGAPLATGELKMKVPKNYIPSEALCFPRAALKDAGLEKQMIAAFTQKGWPEVPKKAIVTGQQWVVKKRSNGVPIRKTIEGTVVSQRDGACIYQNFTFAREHEGGGNYGKLYLYATGAQYDLSCLCLNR